MMIILKICTIFDDIENNYHEKYKRNNNSLSTYFYIYIQINKIEASVHNNLNDLQHINISNIWNI